MTDDVLYVPQRLSDVIGHWFFVSAAPTTGLAIAETPTKGLALSTTEAHLWGSAKNAERLDAAIAQSRKGEGRFVELDHLFAELGIDVED